MEVKLSVRPSIDEVNIRIKELENKYSFTSDYFVKTYELGKLAEKEDFRFWVSLLTARRAYEETGDLSYSLEVPFRGSVSKVFSDARMKLFEEIRKESHSSITELSRVLKRDIKNVYLDLKILENARLVKLVKHGKQTCVVALVDKMVVEF